MEGYSVGVNPVVGFKTLCSFKGTYNSGTQYTFKKNVGKVASKLRDFIEHFFPGATKANQNSFYITLMDKCLLIFGE